MRACESFKISKVCYHVILFHTQKRTEKRLFRTFQSIEKAQLRLGFFKVKLVKQIWVITMLERGKMYRDVVEIVGIDSLVPEDHLL